MGKRNIIHKLFHNLKKPEGFWGRVILREMNKRHTLLSEWGMSHIVWNKEWNVLDIGCGGGANLTQLMHRCPQGKAYGIDISPESVLFAQKKNKKYLDPLYYRKAQITIRVIGIAICLIAFLLLHFVWDKTTF